MGTDCNERCETHLLDDLPAESDAFASDADTGPHEKVAGAIAEMIESAEVGGKAIGLEGGWGSGKSTVVRFLSKRFSNNKDYTVVLFDAWAHEGDPLRRTFLESIVNKLCQYDWVEKNNWKDKLDELANRRKITTTRITPKPTKLGKAMAIALLLVPLGTAFIAGAFRQDVALGLKLPPNWFFCLGLYLVLYPFCVLLYRWIELKTKVKTVSPLLIPIGAMLFAEGRYQCSVHKPANITWFIPAGLLILGPIVHWLYQWGRARKNKKARVQPQTDSGKNDSTDDSDWAFLLSNAINETETETTETPNPTSLEFDQHFSELMDEALACESRRLLLVLDNLDRVDTSTALSIWGTLQTFLHDRDHELDAWYKRLWVLVPYDPIRIRKLWSQEDVDEGTQTNGDSNGAERTTESFLDKSFQVRFHVAPPVLSDWKSFLYGLVQKALPGHVEDQHKIYRVFDRCRQRTEDPPTPRELKLYVNQIGAIHRQWHGKFRIDHVAFYVLQRKDHTQLIDDLRRGEIPRIEDSRLLGDGLVRSLAGLAFNVEATKGLELLLADSISEALRKDDPDDLKRIADRNGAGFWAVLETVATTTWHQKNAQAITKISSLLNASKVLEPYDGPEKPAVLSALRSAGINMSTWMPITPELGDGIGELLTLQDDREFSTTVIKSFCDELETCSAASEGGAPDSGAVVSSLFRLFNSAEWLGHYQSIPNVVTLPFEGNGWLEACSDIVSYDDCEPYWKHLRARGTPEGISEALAHRVASGHFSDSDVWAIRITHNSATELDWEQFCKAVLNRLDAKLDATADECVHLLSALFVLESLNVDAAARAQASLCDPGHLLHHFKSATSNSERKQQAALIFGFTKRRPNLVKPSPVLDSDDGHRLLLKTTASAKQEVTDALYELTERHSLLSEVLSIVQSADKAPKIFIEVLKRVADSESPEVVFTPQVINEDWKNLRQLLNEETPSPENDTPRFQRIAGVLADSFGLGELVMENSFVPESSLLYLDILQGAKEPISEFAEWCRAGLQQVSKEQWYIDLTGNNASCGLCIELSHQGCRPDLKTPFSDALQDHAKLVVQGEHTPRESIALSWSTLVDCIDERSGTRKLLREHLVDIAVSAGGQIHDEFFDMYGSEINDSSILAKNSQVLSHFFSPLVREKYLGGLVWLNEFSRANTGFVDNLGEEYTPDEFTSRLQGVVDNPEEGDAQATIEEIAENFGIEPSPQAKELDESDVDEEKQSEEPGESED